MKNKSKIHPTSRFLHHISNNKLFVLCFLLVVSNFGMQLLAQGTPIRGEITTFNGTAIEGVEVQLTGDATETATTAWDGSFSFLSLRADETYTITPMHETNPLDQISTFDAVLIFRHILGETVLDPYQRIAADVNRSGTITSFDIIEIRRLILGIDNDFRTNTSWRFIPKQFIFESIPTYDVPDFPESISLDFSDENSDWDMHFYGIKTGDVTNNSLPSPLEVRNDNSTFLFQAPNQYLQAGETTTLSLHADLASIDGLQFTLQHEGLELVDIEEGAANSKHFGFFENYIIASWIGNTQETDFVNFQFRATKDLLLSEAIQLNSSKLEAEAYAKDGHFQHIQLAFQEQDYALYQNSPNPFRTETTIRFSLPEAQTAHIVISDVHGKQLKAIEQHFEKGYNEVMLNNSELPTGILYYALATAAFQQTKKMILIR